MKENYFEKNRLEAFSDGVFAIILTILVLELRVPELESTSLEAFSHAAWLILPKFLSFAFSFFLIAIFWVNHHHILQQIEKADTKLLWLNNLFLFFSSVFPFIAAFIGDYPLNPFVVALYPLNMIFAGLTLRAIWKYTFVDTDLAPNSLTPAEKKKNLRQHEISALINLVVITLAFIWVPLALAVIMFMPFLFVVPEIIGRQKS